MGTAAVDTQRMATGCPPAQEKANGFHIFLIFKYLNLFAQLFNMLTFKLCD